MKLSIRPMAIDANDPFKHDVLERKPYAEALSNLVTNFEDELVISLDGQWGDGKTTFVKMWQGLLTRSEVPNIYIDAFANDYADDAFISIASAITEYADDKIDKKFIADLKGKAGRMSWQILPLATKTVINIASTGLIQDCNIDKIIAGVKTLFEQKLNSQKEDRRLIQEFKDTLSSLPTNLKGNKGKPLVIIIDELDRCKPTYAVEVLERIKHLFSVKKVVFVLVMNKQQLAKSLQCVYGQIDAHAYLQKFILVETRLPKQASKHGLSDLQKYSSRLFGQHQLISENTTDRKSIKEFIELFADYYNLSLRELERVYTNLSVFYLFGGRQLDILPILVFLATIKVKFPEVFERIAVKDISYDDLVKETDLRKLIQEHETKDQPWWADDLIRHCLLSPQEYAGLDLSFRMEDFASSSSHYNIDRDEIMPYFARKFSSFNVNR